MLALFGATAVLPAAAAEPQKTDKVAVLDAGTFVTVEAHNATLAEVLDRIGERLKITFTNTDRINLQQVVDGRKSGPLREVMEWLVPTGGFVMLYEERTPNDKRPARVERIGFVAWGNKSAEPSGTSTGPAKPAVTEKTTPNIPMQTNAGSSTQAKPATPSARDLKAGKPDVADTGGEGDIKSVAEQLRAASPNTQLDIEAQAHDPTGQAPLPAFLRPQSDVAQTTLQQQQERSQALAVEQLRALMGAYKAACTGNPKGPC